MTMNYKMFDAPSKGLVLSLFDYSGIMVKPWVNDGYTALQVDIKHPPRFTFVNDRHIYLGGDVRKWKSLLFTVGHTNGLKIVFSFPPCTDLASSGARWFARKREENPSFQKDAMNLVYLARNIGEFRGVPYMIENPVGVISSLWRKPDFTFHPWEFSEYNHDDTYSKRTCLWTGRGFNYPEKNVWQAVLDGKVEIDDRIHKAPDSSLREIRRNTTPGGFAHAVWLANKED